MWATMQNTAIQNTVYCFQGVLGEDRSLTSPSGRSAVIRCRSGFGCKVSLDIIFNKQV